LIENPQVGGGENTVPEELMHYTDRVGYNAIGSQPRWLFLAQSPPGDHPHGAYFTTLPPGFVSAKRLGIPRKKLAFYFHFRTAGGTEIYPLPGGRGRYVFYALGDYEVPEERQIFKGESHL
jgi:hypothetical protein